MFTSSTIAVSAACQEIADSAGASGDSADTTRAGRSLFAGIKYLNGRFNWSWLLTEHTPVSVVAPFGFTATVSAGQSSATAGAGHGLVVDDILTGPNFLVGTRVSATAAGSFGFNQAATATAAGANAVSATAVRDMYALPTDFKQPYTVRLLSTLATLSPAQRRGWDRSITNEFQTGTPNWYDMFPQFQRDKIRLLPPPGGSDTLLIRYYRRMTVPTTTATATVLDIPQDYDFHLIAWAKWHYLMDKTEGRSEQAQVWLSLAQEGIKLMLADQTRQPDETLSFQGHTIWPYPGRGSTRDINWDYT